MAGRHRLPIVEDGFDGTLFYGERPPAPLKSLDASGLVIYIGTFSKILFPGLRLGWIVAPPELIERLEMAKDLADIHTSPILQAAVFHFCRQRLLDRHQARVLRESARRRNALLRPSARQDAGRRDVDREPGRILAAGHAVRGHGRGGLLERAVAARRGVHARATRSSWMAAESTRSGCPSPGFPLDQIDEGVKRLAETIRDVERHPERARLAEPAVPLV